ncbi:MAG: zinc/manganese transport system permease protein [Chloroflexota bacterium]|jgi:zinc/manganese transport system permease protein|nr:zinc/manganese transport system permease protein [Chloroflexota bacterium]
MPPAVWPLHGLQGMLDHEFIRNALLAGSAIAVAAGLVSHLVVLRNQVFAGDALSHMAFTGSLAALAAGVDPRIGLFVATVGVAVGFGALQGGRRGADVVIGSVFAWVLGLGVLALSIHTASGSTGNGTAGVHVLFGSIFGMGTGAARLAILVAAVVAAGTLVLARPLTFATVDREIARAHGVPLLTVELAFLALVGLCVGEATQVVGALPLLGMLATPGAAAHQLTARPWTALWLSAGITLGCVWVGLTVSYAAPRVPPTFAIVGLAFLAYLLARSARRLRAPSAPRGSRLVRG